MARSRYRSVRYDLAAAIEVARLAESAGGTIAPDLLAPALGYSGTNNGAYLSRVASARLFGVVSGRGPRLELTKRGQQILIGVEPASSQARREAFLAVPLFRAVLDATESRAGLLPYDLAGWLIGDFGEVEGKAQLAADQLIASAGQAGLTLRLEDGKIQFKNLLTDFTPVDKASSIVRFPQLKLRRGAHSPLREVVTMAEDGIWLDEEAEPGRRRPAAWRRAGVIASAAAVLIVVAVPVALVAGGSTRPSAVHNLGKHPQVGNGPAEHQVLSALSATTDSGSFNFSYSISSTPASTTAPTTTSTTVCHQIKVPVPTGATSVPGRASYAPLAGSSGGGFVSGSSAYSSSSSVTAARGAVSVPASSGPGWVSVSPGSGSPPPGYQLPPGYQWKTQTVCNGPVVQASPEVTGSGTINTSPFAMVASANIGTGLNVSVRASNSVIYEGGTGDTGLAPLPSDASAPGTSLPGFAGITESTLGSREGAVGMMGLASPTGYLDLVQPAIGAASQTGTGTVDGVPVTIYQVTNDLSRLAGAAGTSPAEAQTITDALTVLKGQGYVANTAVVSIDGAGFIRQVKSTDTFADGGTVTLMSTFSNFGCAGTVLMPGQTGSGVPPTGCTSHDVSNSSSTTTTPNHATPTTVGSGVTTVPSSTPTAPSSSTTTTTMPTSATTSTTTTVTTLATTSTSAP